MRPPRILRTTSFRLAALYAGLFGASVIVLGAVVLVVVRGAMEADMRRRIEADAAVLQTEYAAGGLARLVASVRERSSTLRALDYAVIGPDGARLAGVLPSPGRRTGWITMQGPTPEPDGEFEPALVLVVSLPGGARLLVGDDTGPVEDLGEAVALAFAWGLGLTVVLAVGGGLLLSASFLRRIDAITTTADAIVHGELGQRIPDRGTDDDLDRLARTLNRMLDRIGLLMDGLRQVSSDLAHQLRTPLTRLRQRLEAARSDARDVAELRAAVEGSIAETDAVLETFSALLRIAQIEAGTRRAGFREVDLDDVVSGVVEAFAPSAEEAQRTLSARVVPTVIDGDRELLTQMLANLVENGLRHTPPGTRVEVSLRPTPDGASLVVADDGPGIPAEERARILRRFQRLERSRSVAGSGLGLSLVAAVVELHGARLRLEDGDPGLRVTIEFVSAAAATVERRAETGPAPAARAAAHGSGRSP